MSIYVGNQEITGLGQIQQVYVGSTLIWPVTPPAGDARWTQAGATRWTQAGADRWVQGASAGYSPEVQAVLDRMVALTQTEIDAIEAFVDGLVADSLWGSILEFFCFGLNATDAKTGFKVDTITYETGIVTHQGANGYEFETSPSSFRLPRTAAAMWPSGIGTFGVYAHTMEDVPTGNKAYFGVQEGGTNYIIMQRYQPGTDNFNGNFCRTGSVADPAGTTSIFMGDMVSVSHDGAALHNHLGPDTYSGSPGSSTPPPPLVMQISGRNSNGNGADGGNGNIITTAWAAEIAIAGTNAVNYGNFRARVLQLLRDLGTTGVPAS